jgi:uncharacterized membrane protein YphA (DoxX/SURF4 family)
MAHGFAKLAKGPDAFASILHALVPAPHFMAWVTILTEFLGGLAVILGAFVTLSALPMAAILLVAMFTVHLPDGFSSIKLMAQVPKKTTTSEDFSQAAARTVREAPERTLVRSRLAPSALSGKNSLSGVPPAIVNSRPRSKR